MSEYLEEALARIHSADVRGEALLLDGPQINALAHVLDRGDALVAENQHLRDALAPFLQAAVDYEPHHAARPDDSWVLLVESQDVLAARTALDGTPSAAQTLEDTPATRRAEESGSRG